jgi:formate-dependent nitrite reductase cytochrome c552 subunit
MTAVVRQLRRTTIADAHPLGTEPVDYCQCGRGPVIGVFALRVGGSNDRLAFFPLSSVYSSLPEVAADLCCLDCVTDAVADFASGKTNAELQEQARQRRQMTVNGGER